MNGKKLWVYSSVLCVLMLFAAPVLCAGEPGDAAPGPQKVWAAGAGFLHLKSKGFADFEGQGAGVFVIRNASHTKVKLKGQGKVIHLPGKDALLVVGLKGKLELAGKKLNVRFHGGAVVFHAEGHGVMALKGLGKFKIGGGPVLPWPVHHVKKFPF